MKTPRCKDSDPTSTLERYKWLESLHRVSMKLTGLGFFIGRDASDELPDTQEARTGIGMILEDLGSEVYGLWVKAEMDH